MTIIDRAHKVVLIVVAAVIPTAFLIDAAIELLSGETITASGWPVFAVLAAAAAWQIARKSWNADGVIIGAGLATAVLGVMSYYGTKTVIDIGAGGVIVVSAGLVAVAISRRAAAVSGVVFGVASVYMVVLTTLSENLETDDVIAKSIAVAFIFGFSSWMLYQLRKGYEEQSSTRDQLVAAVSHELRTPLTALAGFSATLVDGTVTRDSEEAAEVHAIIANQAEEAVGIVEDLLVAFRSAPGELTLNLTEVDLAQEAEAVVAALRSSRPADALQFSLKTPSTKVLADPLRVRQIIRNLVTNAYRHGGNQIEVRSFRNQASGHVVVTDNGDGFDSDEIETLFLPYGRSRRTDINSESIGLGLSVARQLAHRMDGDLTARREQGTTVFELSLPLA